ncbi:hypothetical protein [Streptomyces sp. KMM 9044]|uniref:hypothetical protein n=1 Tax=Streptomyces sp. KMM 9044 TaxID=2744474 RepID=UPI002151E28E|nr:hypothetical protein [Streptomyces sp. KMM 9044]WAX81421.1 hypothetical protein HUV60_031055 [Streptomyces sp. KMM 9044]
MAMVGLFWITEDSVYLGAEPEGNASGVRLTKDGVELLGRERTGFRTWGEVHGIEVADVAVRRAVRRHASLAFDVVSGMLGQGPGYPPSFTVHVTTDHKTVTASPFTAITGGIYGPTEYELSLTLLRRLVDGGGTGLDDLLTWRRDHATAATPGREERELLLLKWVGDQGRR